ncbi:MAG: hypothetical protein WA667_01850 [Candidatus Nitrosopolaris sp.]
MIIGRNYVANWLHFGRHYAYKLLCAVSKRLVYWRKNNKMGLKRTDAGFNN